MLRLNRKQNILRTSVKKVECLCRFSNIVKLKVNNLLVREKNSEHLIKLDKISKKIGKIRNLCFLSSRMRGTYRFFKLSRMFIRELGNAGFFMGVRKTSF